MKSGKALAFAYKEYLDILRKNTLERKIEIINCTIVIDNILNVTKGVNMKANEFITNYWNYYIELEHKFINTQNYVAFHKRNYGTFSNEYVELLQIICSEIDVVGKIIAKEYNSSFSNAKNININKWGYEIQKAFPDIQNSKVIFNYNYELIPWRNWLYTINNRNAIVLDKSKNAKSPFWWNAYNKVKHERTSIGAGNLPNYMRANLKSVLFALSALYILENNILDYYSLTEKLEYESSRLFKMKL